MKKRILIPQFYSPSDMTSFLRAWGPFSLMKDEVELVEPPIGQEWYTNFRYWIGIDVCFLHRPYGPYGARIIENAKLHGVPLWVDHDDDLLRLPEKNPHMLFHKSREAITPSIEMSYLEADVLTCSGKVMYEEFQAKGLHESILITTGLDDRLLKFRRPFGKNRRVGWRGSLSHRSDLEDYREQVGSLMRDNGHREWWYFGIDPESIGLPKSYKTYDQLHIFEFYQKLSKANCSLHWVVLEDNHFNRVKSNVSWIDATLAGSAVVGPDFEEWNVPGVIKYKGHGEFKSRMDDMLRNHEDYDHMRFLENKNNESWEYIQDVLLQSKLNEKRREILKNI